VKPFVSALRRVVIIDTGPLVAAIDANDRHHRWARATLPRLSAEVFTCESVIAEAGHLLENHPLAIQALHRFVARMQIIPVLHDNLAGVFALMKQFAPQMDVADACLVALARKHPDGIVLTTDTRDFSTYRIPFASPEGLFAEY
jgi:predicted nucleic acid-binding protein